MVRVALRTKLLYLMVNPLNFSFPSAFGSHGSLFLSHFMSAYFFHVFLTSPTSYGVKDYLLSNQLVTKIL